MSERKRFELNPEQKRVAQRAGAGLKGALSLGKSLLFGSDTEAKRTLENLADEVRGAVDRHGDEVIDTVGEVVGQESAAGAPPPGFVRARCRDCNATETVERRRRPNDELVAALAKLGWRRSVQEDRPGWICPSCAGDRAHG